MTDENSLLILSILFTKSWGNTAIHISIKESKNIQMLFLTNSIDLVSFYDTSVEKAD